MLSAASHELRGPLGVARGYLRLLAANPSLDERAARAAADATRATDQIAHILDELSEYARWACGEQSLSPSLVSLRDVLTTAAEAASLPSSPQVRLEVEAPVAPAAVVDGARLARAWAALITATARAQTEDSTIVLALRPTDPEHSVLRIVPHHLLDAATAERPPALERAGAGLAIALAALIVQRHGGVLAERWAGEAWAGYVCHL